MSSIAPPCHTRGVKTTDDWISPRWLIERLGPFHLDPCSSLTQPWPCAERNLTVADNGLLATWYKHELVWLNPPYGAAMMAVWLDRLALHGNGIALVFARTETRAFFQVVWPRASALLFLRGRLTFHYPDGKASKAGHNSGGPSVLIAYGNVARRRLLANRKLGALVEVNR